MPAATVQEDEGSRLTKRRKLASSTDDLPRLISVVEIVKREFRALVLKQKAGLGNPPGTLLHQYNVLACLEGDQPPLQDNSEGLSSEELLLALEGKNQLVIVLEFVTTILTLLSSLKRNFPAFMKITLCTKKVPQLEEAGAT